LETLPVLPGFFRQSLNAQIVRRCLGINANAACRGSGENASAVVRQTLALEVSIEQFDEDAFREQLARLYGVSPQQVSLLVTAGSLVLTISIAPNSSAISHDINDAVVASINSIDKSTLATSLGAPIASASTAKKVKARPARCAEGYSGVYCAVCAQGFFGGGEGGECMPCAAAGDPTVTIAIQGASFAAVLVLGTFIMLRFGRTVLKKAMLAMEEKDALSSMQRKSIVGGTIELEEEDSATNPEVKSDPLQKKRCGRLRSMCNIGALAQMVASFGVKLKILVSLYQVLNG
jgi:hypothetical protein